MMYTLPSKLGTTMCSPRPSTSDLSSSRTSSGAARMRSSVRNGKLGTFWPLAPSRTHTTPASVATTMSSWPSPFTSPTLAGWAARPTMRRSHNSLPSWEKTAMLPRESTATSSSQPSALTSARVTWAWISAISIGKLLLTRPVALFPASSPVLSKRYSQPAEVPTAMSRLPSRSTSATDGLEYMYARNTVSSVVRSRCSRHFSVRVTRSTTTIAPATYLDMSVFGGSFALCSGME
mmetsp:Transcript_2939/g.5202  ORF Transcript_2939/g.5202 Transcript_2939/m.5202 type:complete len:235 (-) Transcript_2939:227-931(-)